MNGVLLDHIRAFALTRTREVYAEGIVRTPPRDRRFDSQSYRWYYGPMSVAKVALSMDVRLLRRLDSLVKRDVFRSRSEAIQKAVAEKLARMDRSRLARECAKLPPAEEQEMAEVGITIDAQELTEY